MTNGDLCYELVSFVHLEATDEDWHDLLMELARQQVAAQGPIAVPPPSRPADGGDEF